MKGLKSFKKNKNGLMALEYLIGIILSVIALFFIVDTLSSFFLNDPTNLDIAKGNAQSIADFVNFAQNNDYSANNCFYLLKLKNLENFQTYSKNDKENYFYVIDKENLNVIPISDYPNFKTNKNLNSIRAVEKISLNDINLKKDVTDQGSMKIDIEFEFLTLATIGGYSDKLIKLEDNDYIVLFPYLSNFKIFEISSSSIEQRVSSWFDSNQNQNILIPQIFRKRTIEEYNQENANILMGSSGTYETEYNEAKLRALPSNYLAISNNNELFIPNDQYSEILARKNLCSFYKLREEDEYEYLNPKNLDGTLNKELQNQRLNMVLNKKIIYYVSQIPQNNFDKFVWYGKDSPVKFECFVNDKSHSFEKCPFENFNLINIGEFQEEIWNYVTREFPSIENVEVRMKAEELTFDEIINKVGPRKLDFDLYFEILKDDKGNYIDISENQEDKNVFDITIFNRDEINGFEESFSNLIKVEDGKIYSFFKKESNINLYYSFKPSYFNSGLRKRIENEEEVIYFNTKRVEYKKYEADEKNNEFSFFNMITFGGNDNKEIYLLTIDFDSNENEYSGKFDFFLTKNQFLNIREFREK